jgi:hypothetical protein
LKTLAAVFAALMTTAALGACSPSGSASGGGEQGKFTGLDQQEVRWRQDILAADPLCRSQAQDEKCQGFEVTCKAERDLTPADQANGVTARVVAAMTWNGFDPKFKHAQSGMRAAEFAKGKAGWTRGDHKPVNPESCADL